MAQRYNPVNWFEIPVKDMERAKRFYETVFGVECAMNEIGSLKMAMFPMVQGAPNTTGALVMGEGYEPSSAGSVVYFYVDDIESTLATVNANGGKTLMPKSSIGEFGHICHFEDCEGNRVALHSTK